ncbi:MAG: polysaccharide deacetylase family protein [Acidobacteriota bacterium]
MSTPILEDILSVDVEDWFHILDVDSVPPVEQWSALPGRVEQNFRRMLELFATADVRVTCFFLGWVAKQYPDLVREASAAGHEIASHGFFHRLVYQQSATEFRQDVVDSKRLLEDLTGKVVLGFRAPGFSFVPSTPWVFEELTGAGYVYDSSIFPAARGHGGNAQARPEPHRISTPSGPLLEFPISVVEVAGIRLCLFGGGYFRISPYALIERAGANVRRKNRPVIYYIHPREIDPQHPRLPMPALRRFKSYVNLASTWRKLQRTVSEGRVTSFRDWMERHHASVA